MILISHFKFSNICSTVFENFIQLLKRIKVSKKIMTLHEDFNVETNCLIQNYEQHKLLFCNNVNAN